MKRLVVCSILVLAAAFCWGRHKPLNIKGHNSPEIRYELSGGAGHYDYAPSFIIGDHNIIYGFLCENKDPFKIVDHIYLYKGIPTEKGYVWQPGTMIVEPSKSGWDNCHICDPDVRQFHTVWKGESYEWIMTYLGVDQWDCNHNQIGLAVSKCIEGPYIKYDGNPLVAYEGRDKWGVGQSTTIVKNDSTIVLYYHSTSDNGPYSRREIILNDLDNIKVKNEEKVPYLSANSYPAMSGDKVYMVSEIVDPAFEANQIPTWVGNTCKVAVVDSEKDMFSKDNLWKEIGRVNPVNSGFPRNHNPGFLTDVKGYLPNGKTLVVFFTTAETGADWLWSYDLYSAVFKIDN